MLKESIAVPLRVIKTIQRCLDYVRVMCYNGKLAGGEGEVVADN